MVIVKKFGGTSLSNLNNIKNVAEIIAKHLKNNVNIVVVVSAMAGFTDEIIQTIDTINNLDTLESKIEYDSILATGEQVSAALLALTLQSMGIKARSCLGWQLPIITDNNHTNSRIDNIDVETIKECLKSNTVPVIAGFQGVNNERITTLGRGGSDTTAVAIAAAIEAERCDIYTDVEGIYTSDPRIVANARILKIISYEDMLEMSSLGAKVLHPRSVELAMKNNVPLRILSSFSQESGTILMNKEDIMEKSIITGITSTINQTQISMMNIDIRRTVADSVFKPLSEHKISVDVIVQNISTINQTFDLTITIPNNLANAAENILKNNKDEIGYSDIYINNKIGIVSIIGSGMISSYDVAYKMFKALEKENIKIHGITTSEVKISVLIDQDYVELAMRVLHSTYYTD